MEDIAGNGRGCQPRAERSFIALAGERQRFGAATGRGRKLDAVILPELPRERLGRLRPALDFRALLVGQATDRILHRDTRLPSLAPEPGLVPGTDIADGDGGPNAGASCSGRRPFYGPSVNRITPPGMAGRRLAAPACRPTRRCGFRSRDHRFFGTGHGSRRSHA